MTASWLAAATQMTAREPNVPTQRFYSGWGALFYSPVDFTDASDFSTLMQVWCIGAINRWIKQRTHALSVATVPIYPGLERGMCGINFFQFGFLKKLSIRFGISLVKKCSSVQTFIVIYYSCNSRECLMPHLHFATVDDTTSTSLTSLTTTITSK